jgi:hypothetical protein
MFDRNVCSSCHQDLPLGKGFWKRLSPSHHIPALNSGRPIGRVALQPGQGVVGECHQFHQKEPPAGVATLGRTKMKLPVQLQFTRKRRKALVKRFSKWASVLTAVLTLVKLIVEFISMLH